MRVLSANVLLTPDVEALLSRRDVLSIFEGLGCKTNLRDTLLVHPSVERCPSYSSGILPLQEEGLGLAILKSEDLAVASDIELALFVTSSVSLDILCSIRGTRSKRRLGT